MSSSGLWPSGGGGSGGLVRSRRFLASLGLTLGAALLMLGLGAVPTQAAETCSNAKYRNGPSLFLPDCRAYEMVTPPGKTNEVKTRTGTLNPGRVSDDGNTILYATATGPLAEGATAGMPVYERAKRENGAWKLESAISPVIAPYLDTLPAFPRWGVASKSLDRLMFTTSTIFSPAQTFTGLSVGNGGVHLTDGTQNWWVSQPTWAGSMPEQGTIDAKQSVFVPVGGSDDMHTVYIVSGATLTPEDDASGRVARESWAVYKWEDGQLTNAGILPDGSISPGGSVAADRSSPVAGSMDNLPAGGMVEFSRYNAASDDGDSFLFVSPDPSRAAADPSLPEPQLYRAVEGEPSVLISAPEGEDEPVADTAGVTLTGGLAVSAEAARGHAVATPDHSVVVFSTVDALTDDANPDAPTVAKTYRYETADGSLTYLPDLDRPSSEIQGQVLELSPSGDSMLYRTSGNSMRLWRKGASTLTVADGVAGSSAPASTGITHVRFTEDESVLVLNSNGPLRGEANQLPGSNPGNYRPQVYRYVAADDSLECVSCRPGSGTYGASISMWGGSNGFTDTASNFHAYWSIRGVTEDGAIYFTSTAPLVERDHNTVADVYEWSDGELHLLSSGATGSYGDVLYDTSADGESVFIASAEQLASSDTDDFYDIYAVRKGGGIDPPALPASDSGCSGDTCQGPVAERPDLPAVASLDFTGAGNLSESKRRVIKVRRMRAAAGPVARLKVRAPSAGRIVVSGAAVRRVVRQVPKAGTRSLRLALKPQARRRLARSGKVTAPIRVSFRSAEATTAKRLKVTFTQSKAKRSQASAGSRKGR